MSKPVLKRTIFLVLMALLSSAAAAEQYRWSGVDRVVALSDPHGAYSAMVQTLANAGVINDGQDWVGSVAPCHRFPAPAIRGRSWTWS